MHQYAGIDCTFTAEEWSSTMHDTPVIRMNMPSSQGHALLSRRKVRINLCREQNSSKPQTRADDDDDADAD
jgi:hypothetical protein